MPKLSEADSNQWNSVLMAKMSEEKVANLQSDLDKKVILQPFIHHRFQLNALLFVS